MYLLLVSAGARAEVEPTRADLFFGISSLILAYAFLAIWSRACRCRSRKIWSRCTDTV